MTTAVGPRPPDLPLHHPTQTPQPTDPNISFQPDAPKKLSDGDWGAISNDLYQAVNASISARAPLEQNLREWSEAYDLITGEKDFPYEDSSNIRLPFTASQLESLLAYIAGTVLVPRLYIVTGNTPVAAKNSFAVEKFYNAELVRLRPDGSSYFSKQVDFIHLALRDGTAVMEVLWHRRRVRKEAVSYVPVTDPESGIALLDSDGQPRFEERRQIVDEIEDYAKLSPVILKEFILIPDESRSIEEALGVGRVEWMVESQLDSMVRAGLLDSGEVERALTYQPNGTSGVASDRQGSYDKDASQQIGIGQGQGSVASKFFKNRGPIKVWRIHSRQFDMNGDGVPEENIFWFDEMGQRMLGWIPYDYADGKRPFFSFCPFPRPDQFYGYSVIERLAGVQIEMDAQHNARNDQIAFRLSPPMAVEEGSVFLTNRGQWRPGALLEMERVGQNQSAQLFTLPEIPLNSEREEALLKSYGTEYTGLDQPGMGGQSSGRRSATEMKRRESSSGVRLALICTRLRVALGQVANFVHSLNKQYLKVDPQTMDPATQTVYTLPLGVLAQDYTIGIAGATDPIDSTSRRQESMALYDLASKTMPDVMQDPTKRYYWRRRLLESFGLGQEVSQLIGTEEDAQAQKQQQQQQAAAQAASGQPPQQPGQPAQGQPGQQQQKPQQPQPAAR